MQTVFKKARYGKDEITSQSQMKEGNERSESPELTPSFTSVQQDKIRTVFKEFISERRVPSIREIETVFIMAKSSVGKYNKNKVKRYLISIINSESSLHSMEAFRTNRNEEDTDLFLQEFSHYQRRPFKSEVFQTMEERPAVCEILR